MTNVFLGAEPDERTLVVVFLRGGADGLTLVAPVGDDDYQRARPSLALDPRQALPLDGAFGLNPALGALLPLFRAGRLAIVHAAGSDDDTRSHFEAQDLMEHGGRTAGGGWLGRFLRRARPAAPLAGLAFGSELPESLRGACSAAVLRSLEDLGLGPAAGLARSLAELYARDDLLAAAARDTHVALERLDRLGADSHGPEHGALYAADDFSAQLRQTARLVKARVGVRAVCLDLPGWDSHVAQDALLEPLMRALGRGLGAFAADLGALLDTTSVVVLTEFGRRVGENASGGTDHGRGSVMLVLGGGTPGGLHAGFAGLAPAALDGPGDLPVLHDYRDVLLAVLERHAPLDAQAAFPGHTAQRLAV